jgi:hypothetical protein
MMQDRRRIRSLVWKIAASAMVLVALGMLSGCSTESKMPETDKANFKGSRPPDNFSPAPAHGAQIPGK